MVNINMKSMNLLIVLALSMPIIQGTFASAGYHHDVDDSSRAVDLERSINLGKSQRDLTDRDMQEDWDKLRNLKKVYENRFDELVCTEPDKLAALLEEIEKLAYEVQLAWDLKQKQLEALKGILVHENFTVTGLATTDVDNTTDNKVADTCKGLMDYIEAANITAWDEKEKLEELPLEIEEMQIRVDSKPCPCLWGEWEDWGECSTTCGEGERRKTRSVQKNATNNGPMCEGPSEYTEPCNHDPCPIDCVWGEWTNWSNCPSGCPEIQNKTRTREQLVKAENNGKCEGKDFENKPCSLAEDLKEDISTLKMEKERLEEELMKTKKDNLDMKQKIEDLEDKVDQCPCQASQTSTEDDPPTPPAILPSKKYLQETKHEIFPTKPVKPNKPVKPHNPAEHVQHVINIKRVKPNKRV